MWCCGSMSNMSSYKRKRIEKWCEEVSLYLRNGTICRSVIGHVAEDAICGHSLNSAAENNEDRENTNGNIQTSGNTNSQNNSKDQEKKGDQDLKKAIQNVSSNPGHYNIRDSNGVGMGIGSTFPVVKFAYSHYHEQRRKIDRLVQGLPVLYGNGVSAMDRPSSKDSTEEHVPIIVVNGEEPVRGTHSHSRSSSQTRRHHHHFNHAHVMSNNHNVLEFHVPNTARQMSQSFRSSGKLRTNSSDRNVRRSNSMAIKGNGVKEIQSSDVTVTVDPGLALTANDRVTRSKTAPSINRNVHRARQRILTRRGNRILDHTSQIPLQNCWAMAELSW